MINPNYKPVLLIVFRQVEMHCFDMPLNVITYGVSQLIYAIQVLQAVVER